MNQKKLTFLSFSLLIVLSLIIPSLVNGQISSTASNKTIEISPSEIVETKTCPVGCTCFGDNVVCPVEPPCKSPCIKKGNTCTCREESPKTCTACVGGIPTGQKDSNGCPIYSCPEKQCPIGCTCSNDAVTCPGEGSPNCRIGCTCVGNMMTCPAEPPTMVCEACVGGTPTGQKDSNGCPIYSCPEKQCPVGCTCFGDNVVCPVEPPCKSPCIKKGNTCTCREESPKTCPIGCTCSGNATTCPTSELKPIEAKISTESGAKTIFIEKITNGISLKSEKATAITTGNLIIEQGALSFKTSVGNKEIKVLPEEASSKVTNTTKVGAIELKEESQQPIYAVKGKTRAKLLFVIPISMPTETKVNAESGRIISVSKPWWSFLAR